MSENKIYRVPVYYQVCEYVAVKAESADKAVKYVQDHMEDMPVHAGELYYMDDSYEVESDPNVLGCGYDEESRLWSRESYTETYYDATEVNK